MTIDIQSLLTSSPELKAQALKAAVAKRDEWQAVVDSLSGEVKESKRATKEAPEVTDGRKHTDAILEVLAAHDGMTATQLREKMAEEGHPIRPETLGATLAALANAKRVLKKRTPESKGAARPTNIYRVPASAK